MPDKRAVRAIADRLGLDVAEKPDSQDICFVPAGRYTDVVARFRPDALEPGDIVTTDGQVLAQHDGIARYTVGQGKRLGAAAQIDGERQVVLRTDPVRRRIVVGPRGSGTRTVPLRAINWLVPPPDAPLRCEVKLRARDEPRSATVHGTTVTLDDPALAAPGQACVFYAADRVLGGGVIVRESEGSAPRPR